MSMRPPHCTTYVLFHVLHKPTPYQPIPLSCPLHGCDCKNKINFPHSTSRSNVNSLTIPHVPPDIQAVPLEAIHKPTHLTQCSPVSP